jgi:N-acetylglucosamine kinase-like BadF-type ATPase
LQRFDDLVRWAATATAGQVAALAPLVLNAARDGEVVAQRAVADGARELVALVQALQQHFPADAEIPVAVAGGLLAPASPLAAKFWEMLAAALPRARRIATAVDPALAALRMAVGMK